MATFTPKYGTSDQAITITLASLGDGSMQESTALTNAALEKLVGGKITTGTSPTADRTIVFYAYGSVDGGTLYSGGATGTDAAFTGEEEQLFPLGVVTVDGTSDKTYEVGPWSLAAAFGGDIPENVGIIVKNNTGAALNATGGNHDINYQDIDKQSA